MDSMVTMVLEDHLRTNMHYPNVIDLKLIYDTTLTPDDVNDDQSSFAIPRNQILTPFLTHSEDLFLQWTTADGTNTDIPINVVIGFTQYKSTLSRYNYSDPDKPEVLKIDGNNSSNSSNTQNKKRKRKDNDDNVDDMNGQQQEKEKSNNSSWKYVLNNGWDQLKTNKNLQPGDQIRVASFRSHNHDIGFLIFHIPRHLNAILDY